jgi:hypothetical protein
MPLPSMKLLAPLVAIAAVTSVAAAGTNKAAKPRAKTGAIAGVVTFDGPVPEPGKADYGHDAACTSGTHPGTSVVVADGRLAEVLVYIKNGTMGEHAAPADPVVVNQDGCEYTPRVVGVMSGQKLEVRNGDPTFHNVRGNRDGKIAFNLPQNKGAKPIVRDDLGDPGAVTALACDVHPWMQGWAVVVDHPYFAVTGADGAFSLAGLAPGRYELVAWHPTLGTRTAKVTVKRGKKAARATFAFRAD